jgi:hypothetical protein
MGVQPVPSLGSDRPDVPSTNKSRRKEVGCTGDDQELPQKTHRRSVVPAGTAIAQSFTFVPRGSPGNRVHIVVSTGGAMAGSIDLATAPVFGTLQVSHDFVFVISGDTR